MLLMVGFLNQGRLMSGPRGLNIPEQPMRGSHPLAQEPHFSSPHWKGALVPRQPADSQPCCWSRRSDVKLSGLNSRLAQGVLGEPGGSC